jgi:hypothetical protein
LYGNGGIFLFGWLINARNFFGLLCHPAFKFSYFFIAPKLSMSCPCHNPINRIEVMKQTAHFVYAIKKAVRISDRFTGISSGMPDLAGARL